ncbi:hypothetical protein KFL_006580110 [Klebsormidium nitens]|uniref:At2g35280-like TPR domain-containing protein n=1 Tax=Klebsormidium nitens TaxID=105231 RepID=A0A1Y1IKC6_KLENI|nr:hypothetical protein KFL_006580110 [Klebsormidium nitens]|eukprot:GAQ90582.1 hypothetical protein KFL_006580110 [Klebsormidium nitens]
MLVRNVLTQPGALNFLSKIRNAGSLDALYVSGMLRFYSTEEYGIGADMLVAAAEAGHGPALYECGLILSHGSGGDKLDVCLSSANELLYRAAVQGYDQAAIELAMRIRNGWGFQKDRQLGSKNAAGVPYWNAQGGNFRIERRLRSGVDVSFTFAIQEDFSLVVLRSIAAGPLEPCIGFAPAEDDDDEPDTTLV